jgi:hypothetical protein
MKISTMAEKIPGGKKESELLDSNLALTLKGFKSLSESYNVINCNSFFAPELHKVLFPF